MRVHSSVNQYRHVEAAARVLGQVLPAGGKPIRLGQYEPPLPLGVQVLDGRFFPQLDSSYVGGRDPSQGFTEAQLGFLAAVGRTEEGPGNLATIIGQSTEEDFSLERLIDRFVESELYMAWETPWPVCAVTQEHLALLSDSLEGNLSVAWFLRDVAAGTLDRPAYHWRVRDHGLGIFFLEEEKGAIERDIERARVPVASLSEESKRDLLPGTRIVGFKRPRVEAFWDESKPRSWDPIGSVLSPDYVRSDPRRTLRGWSSLTDQAMVFGGVRNGWVRAQLGYEQQRAEFDGAVKTQSDGKGDWMTSSSDRVVTITDLSLIPLYEGEGLLMGLSRGEWHRSYAFSPVPSNAVFWVTRAPDPELIDP